MRKSLKMWKNDSWYRAHVLLGLFIVLFPLIPLLICRYFWIDYINNQYVIQYFRKYLLRYHEFPLVLNASNKEIGSGNPMYYGYLYYRLMALLSVVTGSPRRAVIVQVVVLNAIVYSIYTRLWNRVFLPMGKHKAFFIAHTITAVMIWNIYQINQLYMDGARCSYTAYLLMEIAIGSWIYSLRRSISEKNRHFLWVYCALNVMLVVGTHPLTAEVGGIALVILILCSIPRLLRIEPWKNILRTGLSATLLIVLALSPWLYAVLATKSEMRISGHYLLDDTSVWQRDLIMRIMPFPLSYDGLMNGRNGAVGIPYYTVAVSTPFLFLYIFTWVLLCRHWKSVSLRNRWLSILMLFVSSGFFALSCITLCNTFTARVFYSLQFSSRLIAGFDLCVTMSSCLNLFFLMPEIKKRRILTQVLMAVLMIMGTISLHNVMIFFSGVSTIAGAYDDELTSDKAPDHFYWMDDYGSKEYQVYIPDSDEPVMEINLKLADGELYPEEFSFTADEPAWIKTNISANHFTAIYLNGEKVPKDKIYRGGADEWTCMFYVDQSGDYTIQYQTDIPSVYIFLKWVSVFAVVIMFVWVIVEAHEKNHTRSK